LAKSVLYALPLDGEHKPVEVTKSTSTMQAARLSPDSRLLAYRSDEAGSLRFMFDPLTPADVLTAGNGRYSMGDWVWSRGGEMERNSSTMPPIAAR